MCKQTAEKFDLKRRKIKENADRENKTRDVEIAWFEDCVPELLASWFPRQSCMGMIFPLRRFNGMQCCFNGRRSSNKLYDASSVSWIHQAGLRVCKQWANTMVDERWIYMYRGGGGGGGDGGDGGDGTEVVQTSFMFCCGILWRTIFNGCGDLLYKSVRPGYVWNCFIRRACL